MAGPSTKGAGRWAGTLCAVWLASIVAAAAPARAADVDVDDLMHGPLDGMKFVGTFASDAEGGGRDDALSFAGGRFWSANCVPCGFTPATYWVRQVGDTLHFRGEMTSASSGRFVYFGIIRGDRLSATIDWRKERWYWSVERQFRFEGVRVDDGVIAPVAEVARRAQRAAAEPEPDAYCPL